MSLFYICFSGSPPPPTNTHSCSPSFSIFHLHTLFQFSLSQPYPLHINTRTLSLSLSLSLSLTHAHIVAHSLMLSFFLCVFLWVRCGSLTFGPARPFLGFKTANRGSTQSCNIWAKYLCALLKGHLNEEYLHDRIKMTEWI